MGLQSKGDYKKEEDNMFYSCKIIQRDLKKETSNKLNGKRAVWCLNCLFIRIKEDCTNYTVLKVMSYIMKL